MLKGKRLYKSTLTILFFLPREVVSSTPCAAGGRLVSQD